MRRWKRIKDGVFKEGDILLLEHDDGTVCPQMRRICDGVVLYAETGKMVEIDECGNVIRTYSENDRLNEGTLVGGIKMSKLNKLKEQYEKLGKEIEALEKENEFEPGWYAYWDNNTSRAIEYYIDFIRTNDYLNEKLPSWDNVVKIDKDAFDKLLKPKIIYDWSKIPEWATIAIMNDSGSVLCGDFTRAVCNGTGGWNGEGSHSNGWVFLDKDCIMNPPADWKDSLERRPE